MSTDNRKNGNGRAPIIHVGKLFDALPPHEIEAEMSVLGGMIIDSKVIGDVSELLVADDFYKPSHAVIYQAIVDVWDKAAQLDVVGLKAHLAARDELEQIGGVQYLVELAGSVPSAASCIVHANLIRNSARKRKLIESLGHGLHELYTSTDSIEAIGDRVEQAVYAAASKDSNPEAQPIGKILQEQYDALSKNEGRAITGLETGFFELDETLCGLQDGQMIIIAARPSMGKTSLAVNVAEHMGIRGGKPGIIFSLEMGREELGRRIMASGGNVDSHRMRRNMLSGDDFSRIASVVGEASDSPMLIDDTGGLTITQLRSRSRRLASRFKIQWIIVDYLQLMHGNGRSDRREEEVSEISRGIKALAKELKVPIIALSQLNRKAEDRENNRPKMSDLRESGSIEQDADVVLLLHREDYYGRMRDGDRHVDTNEAEIIIAKQRNGSTGTIKLHWNGSLTKFGNLSHHGTASMFGGGQ